MWNGFRKENTSVSAFICKFRNNKSIICRFAEASELLNKSCFLKGKFLSGETINALHQDILNLNSAANLTILPAIIESRRQRDNSTNNSIEESYRQPIQLSNEIMNSNLKAAKLLCMASSGRYPQLKVRQEGAVFEIVINNEKKYGMVFSGDCSEVKVRDNGRIVPDHEEIFGRIINNLRGRQNSPEQSGGRSYY